jgi:hypothetical protein
MDWASLLTPGLAGALGTFFFIWTVNRRGKNEEPRVELKVGPIVFWFSLVASVLILVLGLLFGFSIFWMDDIISGNAFLLLGLALIVCVIGGGGIWFTWDSRTRWAHWDHANIVIHQKKVPEKSYAVGNISALKYKPLLQLWQIHFVDGKRFIFSEMMTGSKELIALCNKQLYGEGLN